MSRPRQQQRGPFPKPEVTIYADASTSQCEKFSGWGVYVIGPGMTQGIARGGAFKQTFGPGRTMELAAISNGLRIAEVLGLLQPARSDQVPQPVTLYSDCIAALFTLVQRCDATDTFGFDGFDGSVAVRQSFGMVPGAEPIVATIRKILGRTKLDLYVRHVKGHQKHGERSRINNLCDKLAKAGLAIARRGQHPPRQDEGIL